MFNVAIVRMGLAGLWLLVGIGLLLRNSLAPEEWADRIESPHLDRGALLAFALALWNFVRWYAAGGFRPVQSPALARPQPLAPRSEEIANEYNPELDFAKPDESTKSPPSV